MRKSVFYAIIQGCFMGFFTIAIGLSLNDWLFWVLDISGNIILYFIYKSCKDD